MKYSGGKVYAKSLEKMQILQILAKNNVQFLWHFTDIRNLPLIKKLKGLKSKKFLEKNGFWNKVYPGGNNVSHQLDRNLGNWDKISLNFTPHTPMVYYLKREKHLVFIAIDVRVATFSGVYFTDCNATRLRNGQIREKGVKGLRCVKFDYIKSSPTPNDEKWRKYVQAEILVPDRIPISYFKKIFFISPLSLKFGEFLWGGSSSIFSVNPEVFFDYDCDVQGWFISTPYVKDLIITHDRINATKIVKRGRNFWVKISLFALEGTTGDLIIKDLKNRVINRVTVEFKRNSDWQWCPVFKIPSSYFYPSFIIELYLDRILWYKSKWEVK